MIDIPAETDLVEALIPAALAAGRAILDVRARTIDVEHKADSSPVTEADRAAEAIILARLGEVAPDVPVVAEEAVEAGNLPGVGDVFFLVDPLDGTKEFIRGGSDFTVNIALIRDGEPVMGIVHTPAVGTIHVGTPEGAWAGRVEGDAVVDRQPIRVRRCGGDAKVDVVASKSHRTPETDAYIERYPVGDLVSAGSSMKFCLVAEGRADLYPRMGTTMQWDTAAGDAVLRAAGGKVVTLDGAPFPYGPNGSEGVAAFRNEWFVAAGAMELKT
ncbi:3'(2'),5'-bisphosphate nucleotidase CysQ [Bauldia sp.]|uniref:3'(2'),5'-bisphosphate nucleotidase CysQ n=1 Tax=Bauldia sp. TaxID=2575872 RepID=UPI003BAC0D5C